MAHHETHVKSADWRIMQYELQSAVGGSGVSVVDIIICFVTLSNGVEGFGFSYAIGGRGKGALVSAKDHCQATIVGKPFFHPEASWRQLVASCNRTGRGPNFVGLAALDVALWDAYAKTMEVPLGIAMGGAPRAVPVYGSGGYRPNHTSEQTAAQIDAHQKKNFSAIKLRLSGKKSDHELLAASRAACGNKIDIMVDLNEKTTIVAARYAIDMAREYGVIFVEEPLKASDVPGYQALAQTYPGLVVTGEHLQGAVEAAPFLDGRLCGAIQPDLAMMGGLTEALGVAKWAENVGIEVMPHFLPGLFVHLAAVAPNLTWLEDFPLLEPLFDGLPEAELGMMNMSNSHGHGIVLKDEVRKTQLVTID